MTCKKYNAVKGTPNNYIKGHNRHWLGKKRLSLSEDTKRKQRAGHLGKKYKMTEAGIAALRENIKRAHSPEALKKMRASLTGRKLTDEHMIAFLRNKKPTFLEKKFNDLVNKNNLPYKFVGNGSFLIGGYNPDFVNINGKKIAVEIYYSYFKTNMGKKDISEWKDKREAIFKSYGWDTVFFDENQITEANIINSLGGDCR